MDFDWLQNMLDSSTAPVLTAFLLGLITAISPCPLATNIAAIGYIGKEMENRKWIFINGLLYTLGRILAYTILGIVVISILREGASIFGVQKFVAKYGEMVIGPALLLIGLYMLFGHKLRLPSFGFSGKGGEKIADKYEVAWSALVIVRKDGKKEKYVDLTKDGFKYAVKDPDKLKGIIANQINAYLK